MQSKLTLDDYAQLAAVYNLLSRLWLEEVDEELLLILSSDEMSSAIEALGGFVPTDVNDETVQQLAIDYSQTLIGPQGHIMPVQSVWQSENLRSESADSMRKYFESLNGFEPCHSLPDHIAVQLQFMSEVFEVAVDEESANLANEIADSFFNEHLKWTAPFLAAVSEKANTDFYKGLANLTANFLHLEPSEY